MTEKRRSPRYSCKIKAVLTYYEGDPDKVDPDISISKNGKGIIHDISQGGLLLITDLRVAIGMPVSLAFKTRTGKLDVRGRTVRTGILQNNPTEIARKFLQFSGHGDSYIAVEFTDPLPLESGDLQAP